MEDEAVRKLPKLSSVSPVSFLISPTAGFHRKSGVNRHEKHHGNQVLVNNSFTFITTIMFFPSFLFIIVRDSFDHKLAFMK